MGSLPGKAKGYGNLSTAQHVFRVDFDEGLSSLVRYEAWDNDQTFPTLEPSPPGTTTNTILAGTTGNSNKSMVCLIDTTNAAPSSDWKPASASAGEANPNRLKGQTNYVEEDGSILTSGGDVYFNMVIEIPSDATTSSTMGFEVWLRYTYTGSAPTPAWYFNHATTGTEGSPDWTAITPGTHGVLHCRAGSGPTGQGGDNKYYANIPSSSTEDTAEAWVDSDTTP